MILILKTPTKYILLLLFSLTAFNGYGQNKNVKKVDKEIEKAVDNTIDAVEDMFDIFDNKSNIKKQNSSINRSSTKRNDEESSNKKSKRNNKTYSHNLIQSSVAKGYTRYNLADNLVIDIKGTYPPGEKPRWTYVNANPTKNNYSQKMITANVDIYKNDNIANKQAFASIFIRSYNNRAVFVCNNSYADIEIEDGVVALTNTPQTFNLVNFRVCNGYQLTETPIEEARSAYINGGAKGQLTLSCNSKGDIDLSFEVQFYHKASRNQSYGISSKFYINNYSIPNHNTAEEANTKAENVKKYRIEDSIKTVEYKKRELENERLFEIKIKNSITNIIKLHKTYYSNFNSLKADEYEKEESYTSYETRTKVVAAPYDPKTGRYTDIESEQVPVFNYRMVRYNGYRNNSNRTIYIKGIRKLKSKAGTIYYEDESIMLEPNEISNELVDIEENYYPSKAEIGSTHYYKGNILK